MTFTFGSLKYILLLSVFILCIFAGFTHAQIPDIVVRVGNIEAPPGTINTPISIYLDNRVDTIAGFNLWLQLDRPDIMLFQTDTATIYDTTFWICDSMSGPACVDSTETLFSDSADFYYETIVLDTIGNIDITGTLVENWDLVDSRSISGFGTDINIVGIADLPGGGNDPGIPAGQQGGVLIKILADVFSIADTAIDRTVNILIQSDFKDHFGFSRPNGSSIPWVPEEIIDTSCFICEQWVGEICASYQEVQCGFFDPDSIYITPDTIMVLDTANVKIFNGSLTVLSGTVCGNVYGSTSDTLADISDLLFLVDYMFLPPGAVDPPDPECLMDINCDGQADISDLLYLVEYMFSFPSGPAPCDNCCSLMMFLDDQAKGNAIIE